MVALTSAFRQLVETEYKLSYWISQQQQQDWARTTMTEAPDRLTNCRPR